jgi:hypothetical protein
VKKDCSQPYLREENVTEQIAAALTSLSLPDDMADWLAKRLEGERHNTGSILREAKWQAEKQIEKLDNQLDRLTAGYLDAEAFTAAEFRKRKEEALTRKRQQLDSIAALDREDIQRFEPITRFVNGSKQMKYAVETSNPLELRAELENVGSNLTIRNRKIHVEPRGAWKLVVDQGSFAQHNAAPEISGAAFLGETRLYPSEWSRPGSNRQPPRCKRGALPIELRPL